MNNFFLQFLIKMNTDLNSFIYSPKDTIHFFGEYDNEDEKEFDILNNFFCYKEDKENFDEINFNNITNVSETDKFENNEKGKKFKSNLDNDNELNETSLTLQEEIEEEIKQIPKENKIIENPNLIFKIDKINKKKKQKCKIHIIRKNDPDTIRRKIKPHFHKYFIDLLNKKIQQKKLNSKKIKKFLKLNNYLTSTVSINLNKKLIERKIGNILKYEPISSKYRTYDFKNNAKIVNLILKKNDIEINKILNMKYKDLFSIFLNSQCYKNLLEKLRKKEGENYVKLFDETGKNFVFYFMFTEPKNEKNKDIINRDKFGNHSQRNEISFTLNENQSNESLFFNYYNNEDFEMSSDLFLKLEFKNVCFKN